MTVPVAVGVDNGGTWIRMIGLDSRGRRVWSLKKPSPNIANLPSFLQKHLKRFHGELHGLAVGSRAIWKQAKRRSLKRALHGIAKRIVVTSDVEAAWLTAFKTQGILVIAGTGSIAYGRTTDGKFARAGGLGPQRGDEGSGYWIGKEWLRKTKRLRNPRTANVREIAALAPKVLSRARQRDPIARGIVRLAQSHLASLVWDLVDKLHWKKNLPLSVSGSVLQNDWFREGFLRQVNAQGIRFKFHPIKQDVAYSLAILLISHRS